MQVDALASILLRNHRRCQSGVMVGEVPEPQRWTVVPGAPALLLLGPLVISVSVCLAPSPKQPGSLFS